MRVAIVGSRDFPDDVAVRNYVYNLPPGDEVVTGDARGVDADAAFAAEASCRGFHVLCAEWRKYGRSAGPIRNAKIVAMCDRLVAFWDGRSRGTQDAVEQATKAGKPVEIHYPAPALSKSRPIV